MSTARSYERPQRTECPSVCWYVGVRTRRQHRPVESLRSAAGRPCDHHRHPRPGGDHAPGGLHPAARRHPLAGASPARRPPCGHGGSCSPASRRSSYGGHGRGEGLGAVEVCSCPPAGRDDQFRAQAPYGGAVRVRAAKDRGGVPPGSLMSLPPSGSHAQFVQGVVAHARVPGGRAWGIASSLRWTACSARAPALFSRVRVQRITEREGPQGHGGHRPPHTRHTRGWILVPTGDEEAGSSLVSGGGALTAGFAGSGRHRRVFPLQLPCLVLHCAGGSPRRSADPIAGRQAQGHGP